MLSPAEALARALAERLDAAVPPPVSVRAEGAAVAVYVAGEWWGSTYMDDDSDEPLASTDGAPWVERVETTAGALLSSVQDTVAVALRAPWPALPDGGMALPHARAAAGRVHLWYGPDEAAVVALKPLSLAELVRPAT
jgi:hypothetical protein